MSIDVQAEKKPIEDDDDNDYEDTAQERLQFGGDFRAKFEETQTTHLSQIEKKKRIQSS